MGRVILSDDISSPLSMIRRILVAGAIVAALTPSAFAAGSFGYGNDYFRVPENMEPLTIVDDCSSGTSDDGFWYCHDFADISYQGALGSGWNVEVFKGANIPEADPDIGSIWSQTTLANFKQLLAGTKIVGDFYDASGVLKDPTKPVFELAPFMGSTSGFPLVKDIKEIRGTKTYGYSFTAANEGQDFPPDFTARVGIMYFQDKDLFVILSKNLPLKVTTLEELEKSGKKLADGSIDYDYYNNNGGAALKTFLSDFYGKNVSLLSADAEKDIQAAASDIVNKTAETQFRDVPLNQMLGDAINYVKAKGYVAGYADGTFKPSATINRAEFTKILVEATNKTNIELLAQNSCFKDVPSGQWYTKYVCYAKQQGIISGYPDGTFAPDKGVNVAEALKIVLNTYKIPTPPEGKDWFTKYWSAATDNGFLKRIPATPARFLTRAEMAELITRVENTAEYAYYQN